MTRPDVQKDNTEDVMLETEHAKRVQDYDPSHLTGSCCFQPLKEVRTILVTGGAGFIGGWLTRHLAINYRHAYDVICFDRLDRVASERNFGSLRGLPNFKYVYGDITDYENLVSVIKEYRVDCIVHFAARSHVQDSFSSPMAFTHDNVIGTHVILEAARACDQQIKRIVHISTDEVYGETMGHPASESTALAPTNPYAASKAAAEMYVHAYQKSYNLPVIVVRSNNVYGPCQYPEKIIPRFIFLAATGRKLTLQGDGMSTRRYLYGSDAADALDTVLHRGIVGDIYNVGSTYELSNCRVAAQILFEMGHIASTDINSNEFRRAIEWIADRPFNDGEYNVKGGKLEQLGWRQRVAFPEGLKRTIAWYLTNMYTWWDT